MSKKNARRNVVTTLNASIRDGLELVKPIRVSRSKKSKPTATILTTDQVKRLALKLARKRKISREKATKLTVRQLAEQKVLIVPALKKPVAPPKVAPTKNKKREVHRYVETQSAPASAARPDGHNPAAVCWKRSPDSRFHGRY